MNRAKQYEVSRLKKGDVAVSNCVTIHGGTLRFRTDELDVASLVSEIEKHEVHDYYTAGCKNIQDESRHTSLRCYLTSSKNGLLAKKHMNMNGMREPKYTIQLQKYAHTFRDLKQVLWLVSQYLKHSKAIMLELEDEDMETGRFYADVLLEPQKWPVSRMLGWKPEEQKIPICYSKDEVQGKEQ